MFEFILIAIIASVIKGGSIEKLKDIHIKNWLIFGLVVMIEAMVFLLLHFLPKSKLMGMILIYPYVHLLTYLLFVVGIVSNYKLKGGKLMALGSLMNLLALLSHRGRMPVSPKALRIAGQSNTLATLRENRSLTHCLTDSKNGLALLGDMIPIPKAYPLSRVISVGDIFIMLGLAYFAYQALQGKVMENEKIQ